MPYDGLKNMCKRKQVEVGMRSLGACIGESGRSIRPSPSPPTVWPIWSLGQDVSQLGVVFVLLGMMHSHVPSNVSCMLSPRGGRLYNSTFVNYRAWGTYAPGPDRTGRHIPETRARGRV
jgi:hypothetical protein